MNKNTAQITIDEILQNACELWQINETDLLSKKRSTINNLKILVSVFFVANKFHELKHIAKRMNKTRGTLYYYSDLLKPKNQLFYFIDNINKLEEKCLQK